MNLPNFNRISIRRITEAVRQTYERSLPRLPPDIAIALECAAETEPNERARAELVKLNERFHSAYERGEPLCPAADTAAVFVDFGRTLFVDGGQIPDAVWAALPQELKAELYMLDREGDGLEITVSPFCAAMRSRDKAAVVSDFVEIEELVLSCMRQPSACPCAPVIVGIGIDADPDDAVAISRRALLRPIDERSTEPRFAELEERITAKLNALGIGVLGLGGELTCLATAIDGSPLDNPLECPLTCAVSFGCHSMRRRTWTL